MVQSSGYTNKNKHEQCGRKCTCLVLRKPGNGNLGAWFCLPPCSNIGSNVDFPDSCIIQGSTELSSLWAYQYGVAWKFSGERSTKEVKLRFREAWQDYVTIPPQSRLPQSQTRLPWEEHTCCPSIDIEIISCLFSGIILTCNVYSMADMTQGASLDASDINSHLPLSRNLRPSLE